MSKASRSSSSSDALARVLRSGRPSLQTRAAGLFRLVHPFPSLLNGAITLALALVAAGNIGVAIGLGTAMACLQFSIGALNDVVDAPRDAGVKPRKPIPAGAVSPWEARVVFLVGLVGGLALTAWAGAGALPVAAAGTAAGYIYDLRLKGTAFGWAPFAVGLPLLPVYAWVGATGELPPAIWVLVPLGALAGAGLAIANALADAERDRASGVASVATLLGRRRAWAVHAAIQLLAVGGALGAIWTGVGREAAVGNGPGSTSGGASPAGPAAAGSFVAGLAELAAIAAAILVLAGIVLARQPRPARRELGWEVEAAGVGLLAVAWLLSTVRAG